MTKYQSQQEEPANRFADWSTAGDWPRFAHHAMATFYEIVIRGVDKEYAGQAAQAVFAEIDRLEETLSRFRPNSEISRINALKIFEETTVGPETFACLQLAANIYQQTRGAFDSSAGRLIGLWKEADHPPIQSDIDKAQAACGMPWLRLDENTFSVKLMNEAINIDLGGIGKGYAIDKAVEVLREWEIPSALIHSGTSTVFAYDEQGKDWPVIISGGLPANQPGRQIALNNRALSGSGLQKGSHIIDPRTGKPVSLRQAAWALAPTAAVSDALSTAFMVMRDSEILECCGIDSNYGGLLVNTRGEVKAVGNFPD